MRDYAPGLRPRPNTPGYPSGTKYMCTSALMRDRKRGHVRLTTLSACGLGRIQPGTHRVRKTPALLLLLERLIHLLRGHIAERSFQSSPIRRRLIGPRRPWRKRKFVPYLYLACLLIAVREKFSCFFAPARASSSPAFAAPATRRFVPSVLHDAQGS